MSVQYFVLILIFCFIVAPVLMAFRSSSRLKETVKERFGKPPSAKMDIKSISAYWEELSEHGEDPHVIDDITWNDLDMDGIFRRTNACHTSAGEEYLYALLHRPQLKPILLRDREKLMEYLDQNPDMRIKLQLLLMKTGKSDYNGVSSILYHPETKKLKYPKLYTAMSWLPLLFAASAVFFWPVGLAGFILSVIANGITYYTVKNRIMSELAGMRYVSSMLWCCKKICALHEGDFGGYKERIAADFQPFKRLSGKISGIMQRGFSDLDFFAEYARIVFLTDIKKYNKVMQAIGKDTPALRRLYESLGEMDAAVSILSFRKSLSCFAVPEFTDEGKMDFEEIYHPLLTEPVPNSALIDNDCIVTGSNASGKSTFIKAMAINGILAETVHTCCARRFRMKPALIVTSMATRDNIVGGESYFVAEIKSLKRIIDKVDSVFCVCFIDEILKGTNTVERIAASAAVMKYLHGRESLSIVASHDIELTEILKGIYDNYHFREQITENGILFDYKLKEGPSNTRNAIKLLEFMAYDGSITREAERLAKEYTENKKWY
jgi:hypothetical protein